MLERNQGFAALVGVTEGLPEVLVVEAVARPGLLSTAITSFVKSMLSCEYIKKGTPLMLMPDLSNTRSRLLALTFSDFVQRLFVSFGPIVIFFLGGILGVVDFCFGFLGLVVILKRALHIDRSDFQRALCESRNRKGERQCKEYGQRLFHKTEDTVVGIALDCNHIYSFKIDNQH